MNYAYPLNLSYNIKSHPLTININLFKQIIKTLIICWQNPNDPDDENEHFKQPHIAIEKKNLSWDNSLKTYSTLPITRTPDNSNFQ